MTPTTRHERPGPAVRYGRLFIAAAVVTCCRLGSAQEAGAAPVTPIPPPAGDAAPAAPPSVTADAESLARAYRQLVEEHRALAARLAAVEARERQRAHDVFVTPPRPSLPALLGFGANGFFLRTPDDSFLLRVRSVIQADGRAYFDDAFRQQDTFLIRRARLYIEGTVGDFLDYRLMPDFAGGQVVLFDAWVNLRPWSWLQLRAGKMKTPFGLERLQSEQNLVFLERGLTQDLAPDRDIGATLHGDLGRGTLTWEVGVLDGVPDGGSTDLDNNYGKDFVARLFAHPLRPLHKSWLDELGLGVAGIYGKQHGTATATGLSSFKSEGQLTFFSWIADAKTNTIAVAEGDRWRVSPQLYYYVGPVGLQAEYVYSSTNVTTGIDAATIANQAWQLEASFVLTLEHPSYDGLKPKRPFSVRLRQFGALELAARVDQLFVDDAAFPRFADPAKSARRATGFALQLNWYFTSNVRFGLLFARTVFTGGAGTGDRPPEHALLGRLQVAF